MAVSKKFNEGKSKTIRSGKDTPERRAAYKNALKAALAEAASDDTPPEVYQARAKEARQETGRAHRRKKAGGK